MKQYKPRTRLHLSDPNEGNLHVSKHMPRGGEAMPIVPKPSISLSESSIPVTNGEDDQ